MKPLPVEPSLHAERLKKVIAQVEDLLQDNNSITRLHALQAIRAGIEVETLVAVRNAREQRMSWESIGRAFGITRQSAHVKWGKTDEPDRP